MVRGSTCFSWRVQRERRREGTGDLEGSTGSVRRLLAPPERQKKQQALTSGKRLPLRSSSSIAFHSTLVTQLASEMWPPPLRCQAGGARGGCGGMPAGLPWVTRLPFGERQQDSSRSPPPFVSRDLSRRSSSWAVTESRGSISGHRVIMKMMLRKRKMMIGRGTCRLACFKIFRLWAVAGLVLYYFYLKLLWSFHLRLSILRGRTKFGLWSLSTAKIIAPSFQTNWQLQSFTVSPFHLSTENLEASALLIGMSLLQ